MVNLKNIESTQLDYKLSLETGKPKSWLKSVSAFANSQGGHIVFGATDDTHTFVALMIRRELQAKLQN